MMPLSEIPVLETERLVMRGPEPRDAEAYAAFFATERGAWVGGNGTLRRGWQAFAVEIGHWALRGFGMWAVCLRGQADCVGYVGLYHPLGNPEPEIGWMLWQAAEGRGIAHEAALAARAHAYGVLGWPTAVSYIDHGNTRSIKLAERLGAVRDPKAEEPGEGLVYRHPSPAALGLGRAA